MLIKSFLDYLWYERNYSEKTVLAYSEDIKQLQEFAQEEYGRFNPLEVEAELIREWIVSLMDRGYTSTSVNRKLSSLRSFYKYLLRQGEVTKAVSYTHLDVYKRQGNIFESNRAFLEVALCNLGVNNLVDQVTYTFFRIFRQTA